MQKALLTELPQPDHLDIVARYRAAGAHDEVGGDWYDAVVMPSGSTNLMIGDVSGHDIAAAATMGGLRNMLRALAWAIDEPPSANVGRLDRAARDLDLGVFATLIFARIEQDDLHARVGLRTLRWTNAGHPPPILVLRDGSSSCSTTARPRPDARRPARLRAARSDDRRPARSDARHYTDGLIETRGGHLDAGIARLVAALEQHRGLGSGRCSTA